MARIDWKDLFKVKIASSDPSMQKHEVVKLLLLMKLLYKHRKCRDKIVIYTEFKLDNGLVCDVYYEDLKNKEVIAYEIQKKFTTRWLDDRKEKYKDWEVPLFNSADWIPIDLNKCPDDIEGISKWIEEYLI